ARAARPTGAGRYLGGLRAAWPDAHPQDSFVRLSPRSLHVPEPLRGRVETKRSAPKVPGTLWLQTLAPFLASRAGADAFFGPLGVLPLHARLPGVVTVHDLTPLLFPEWHRLKNRVGYTLFLPTLRAA